MVKRNITGIFLVFALILFSLVLIALPTFFTETTGRHALNKQVSLPVIEQQKKPILLIFFGYTGCIDVCTPRLEQIAQIHRSLSDELKENTQFLFFDISAPIDPVLPDEFAKAFHKSFQGFGFDNEELFEYTRAFDVYFARSLSDINEYDHTSHLYIVKKAKKGYYIRFVYHAYPYDDKLITNDLKALLDE